MTRPDKINYYLDIAETVSKRSTCLRKQYGAIIVKNDIIISTGYNGAPRGRKNPDGTYRDIVHPINASSRNMLETTVINAYFEKLKEIEENPDALAFSLEIDD